MEPKTFQNQKLFKDAFLELLFLHLFWFLCDNVDFEVALGTPGGGQLSHFSSLFLSCGSLGAKVAQKPCPNPPQRALRTDFGAILWTPGHQNVAF